MSNADDRCAREGCGKKRASMVHRNIGSLPESNRHAFVAPTPHPAPGGDAASCGLCDVGHPLDGDNHIPTQRLGMIPVTRCRKLPPIPNEPAPSGDGDVKCWVLSALSGLMDRARAVVADYPGVDDLWDDIRDVRREVEAGLQNAPSVTQAAPSGAVSFCPHGTPVCANCLGNVNEDEQPAPSGDEAKVREKIEDDVCEAMGCDPKEDLHREHVPECSAVREVAVREAYAVGNADGARGAREAFLEGLTCDESETGCSHTICSDVLAIARRGSEGK